MFSLLYELESIVPCVRRSRLTNFNRNWQAVLNYLDAKERRKPDSTVKMDNKKQVRKQNLAVISESQLNEPISTDAESSIQNGSTVVVPQFQHNRIRELHGDHQPLYV